MSALYVAAIVEGVKRKTIRTWMLPPRDLPCRLREAAPRKGRPGRRLMVAQWEPARPQRRLGWELPIIAAAGRGKMDLTNEQIYELTDFP
jgi:hypothetical protein